MRYSEKKYDFQINNPIQLIVMTSYTIISAPFRLFSEISKKIVFLGDRTRTFFVYSVLLNTLIMIVVVLKELFLDKRINLFRDVLSVSSLIASLAINIVLFIVFMQFREDVSIDEDYDNCESYEATPRETNAESDEMINLLEELNGMDSQEENSTLTEKLSSMDNSSTIGDSELNTVIDNLPKEQVDPIYLHETECSDRVMASKMTHDNYSNMSDFDLEIMRSLDDDEDSDRKLGERLGIPTGVEDSFDYTSIDGERMLEAITNKNDSREGRTKLFMEELNNLS